MLLCAVHVGVSPVAGDDRPDDGGLDSVGLLEEDDTKDVIPMSTGKAWRTAPG